MKKQDIEKIVEGKELVDEITTEPLCAIHRCRMIHYPSGLECPLCRNEKDIEARKEMLTSLQ